MNASRPLVAVKLSPVGRAQTFLPPSDHADVAAGQQVVVQTDGGPAIGTVVRRVPVLDDRRSPPADSPQRVVRVATRDDVVARLKHQHREQEAYRIALLKIREHGLAMKLARVEQAFDGTRLMASTVGSKGLGILFTLGKLVGLMYVGLAIFALIVLGAVSTIIRVPFLAFVRAIREPFLIAFTTASSEAALPKAMEVMERFGVPKNIVAFVLPTGYSFNLDGSTLYLSLASVFVAQMAGVSMTLGQQLIMRAAGSVAATSAGTSKVRILMALGTGALYRISTRSNPFARRRYCSVSGCTGRTWVKSRR